MIYNKVNNSDYVLKPNAVNVGKDNDFSFTWLVLCPLSINCKRLSTLQVLNSSLPSTHCASVTG